MNDTETDDTVIVWQTDEDGRKYFTDIDYLHGDRESRRWKGEELGLGKDEDLLDNYSRALYEVKIELRIYKDGSDKITKIDDREVKDK